VCPSSDADDDCVSSQQPQVSTVTTHTDAIVHTDRVDRILMQFVSDIRAAETMDSP
jgi:hypothetical protein